MMKQREKLMKLIREFLSKSENGENMADYLLTNGVVVLPCKVYKPWLFDEINVDEYEVTGCKVELYAKCGSCRDIFNMGEIGKTVFLTKEEAERALAKRKGGDE